MAGVVRDHEDHLEWGEWQHIIVAGDIEKAKQILDRGQNQHDDDVLKIRLHFGVRVQIASQEGPRVPQGL